MCTKTVGHTYRWEGTDCQKVTADGDFIGGNFIHEMCTKTVGHTYRWKGRDCQQVSAEGNFIRSNFGDEFCNETKDFFDSLNSCAKKIPNVTLVFGKNEILKETARLLNEACNSNEVSDFPKCYASYHFIELKKSRILGATERESVEFCRKTENNLGVANCFNKLKALDFSTESSFKYCSQNYSPEFVSCAQSLTKYKNVNLLKPKDEVLSVCHSRPLTQDQLNCFGSLTKKLVDPENAFEVCSYSKDSKYSGCLISNISVKSDFSKGKQICQAAAQSSSYIGLESLSEDLNKLAKVSYPGLAKIYRKQAEYLAKYKFNTGNWNAENDIFAFTVLSLSPFIEYNTAS